MLKPTDLATMTPEQKTRLLLTMGAQHYMTERFSPKLARDLDLNESTVRRWTSSEILVPNAVLFTLDCWVNGQGKAEAVVQASRELPADLLLITEAMARVAINLRRIVNHQNAATGESPAVPADASS